MDATVIMEGCWFKPNLRLLTGGWCPEEPIVPVNDCDTLIMKVKIVRNSYVIMVPYWIKIRELYGFK